MPDDFTPHTGLLDRVRYMNWVRFKFALALFIAVAWTTMSIELAQPWLRDLGALTTPWIAFVIIGFIAFVPGFMYSFFIVSLLLDRRPRRIEVAEWPGVTVLMAAYNEEKVMERTLRSVLASRYPGPLQVFVIDDGSKDGTADVVRATIAAFAPVRPAFEVRLIRHKVNRGKAAALNTGLANAAHSLIATVDADCRVTPSSIRNIVECHVSQPVRTHATAGAVLVDNAAASLMTQAQQWDYFHGIAAVKRMQSMYHGTLVAQGAFSLFEKRALDAIGGWPETVGEDIVMTWAMLKRGYRIGYAEDAFIFTVAPATFRQFAQQRKRWSRGLIEALEDHQDILVKPRLTTMFHWWNLLFLPLDLVYTTVFIPGLVLAMFGYFWIAGPMTLALLPLVGIWNLIVYRIQSKALKREDLELKPQYMGLVFYLLVYALMMQPICVWGYLSELTGQAKKWGTK
ncbi:glycosyltransferase [Parablastomonas sp. CN1-191]|uniref:glycosyltransferase n=1 Tax=Parablastomonas sp. CN1-191 TaxID=3400908 RepID=UPI003BF807A6